MSMKHVCSSESKTKISGADEDSIQPNALDLRLDKIFLIRPGTFIISEEDKRHRGSVELSPSQDGWFTLKEGSYEVIMENIIEVGDGEAGWVITRSTLNRNGVFLTSGLYDSGYHGVMAGVMHVTTGPMKIRRGTRIGQYLSFNAEALHKYDGSYGIGKEHDQKYGTLELTQDMIQGLTEAPKVTIHTTDHQLEKRGRGRPRKVAE